METIDLKSIWHEVNIGDRYDRSDDIERMIGMKHGKIISKILFDQKLKILLYSIAFAVFLGLTIYAFGYLKLYLSVKSIVPFFAAGLFLFAKMISEIGRFRMLINTTDNMSVKESIVLFRKKINRIGIVDFIVNLIFFYGWIIWSIIVLTRDPVGIKSLGYEVILLMAILLLTPWMIKRQHHRRYKKLYSNLDNSLDFFHNIP